MPRFLLKADALGTDDRQFYDYATRHTRELALSGIEKVYFAVVSRGFRQEDLDKLAGLMTGTPIRSVCFIEHDGADAIGERQHRPMPRVPARSARSAAVRQ